MSDTLTNEQYEIIEDWLGANGYGGIEAWAEDSDYTPSEYTAGHPEPHVIGWVDEQGNPVDLYVQAWFAREAEQS